MFRTAGQIRALFVGLDLIPPGLPGVTSSPGRLTRPTQSPALQVLAGVGRKTAPSTPD